MSAFKKKSYSNSILYYPIHYLMRLKSTFQRAVLLLITVLWSSGIFAQPGIGISYRVSLPSVPRPTITNPAIAFNTINTVGAVQRPGGTFTYAGLQYDGFVACSNGWLALVKPVANGGAATGTNIATMNGAAANDLTAPSTATGGGYPVIAPLWDNFTVANVGYNLQANIPGFGTNVWCIRWSTCTWAGVAGSTFFVLINPANGAIRFVYENIATTVSAGSASIGLTGACDGDYYSWVSTGDVSISNATAVSGNSVTFGTAPTGLTAGMMLLPGNTTASSFTSSAVQTSNTFIPFSVAPAGVTVGMYVTGPNVPPGTTVTAISTVAPIGVTISQPTTALNPVLTRFVFSYFPAGTTLTGGIGTTTLTFSNPSSGTWNAGAATFRFVSQRNDSTQHNANVGSGTAAPRPGAPGVNYFLDWTPGTPWNDGCAGASLSCTGANPNLGIVGGTCTPLTWATTHATASFYAGMPCQAADDGDVWFTLTKPIGVGNFVVRTAAAACSPQTISGTSVEVFQGASCGAMSTVGCETTNIAGSNSFGEIAIAGNACAAQTYFIRVTTDGDASGKFTICAVQDNSGSTCANAISVPSLPYIANCQKTTGFGNDYNNNGCNTGQAGEDIVYEYISSGGECLDINMTSITAGSNPGIFIFLGCPTSGGTCVGSVTGTGTSLSLSSLALVAAGTYYIVIDNTAGSISSFNLEVVNASNTGLGNDEVAGATPVIVGGACVNSNTFCATATTTCNPPLPSCGNYANNADVWFSVVLPGSGVLNLTTSAGPAPSMTDPVMAVYAGSCGSLVQIGCNDNSALNNFPVLTVSGIPGSTVFVRIWAKTGTALGNFQICAGTCTPPPYDNCSGALPLGTPSSGVCSPTTYTTNCATGSNAPIPAPTCGNYSGGDVWFTVTAPANGNYTITTFAATTGTPMTNGAMAVYSGSCGALSLVTCNDGGAGFPTITLSNIPAGTVYYVRIWPEAGTQAGTFQLCVTSACNSIDETCSAGTMGVTVGTPSYTTFTNTCATKSCGIPNNQCVNFSTAIGSAQVISGGAGYGANATYTGVTIGGGPGTGATATVTTNASGAVISVTMTVGGTNYFPGANCFTGTLNVGSGTPALPAPTTPASVSFGRTSGYNDVWITVTVPPSGNITITGLVGTMTDPVMQVYTSSNNTCSGTLTPIACNDDGGPGLAPEVNLCSTSGLVTPGQILFIRIWPYSTFTSQGTFQLAALDPAAGATNPYQQDNPCTITQNFPVTIGTCSNYTLMSLRCYTPTTNTAFPGIPNPFQCWPLGGGGFGSDGWNPSNDLWVRVIVPAGVTGMNFLTQAGTEGDDNMAVYRSTNCSTMTQLGCDDLNGPGLMPYLSLGGLIPGETLYVRHYPWNGSTVRQGDFYFCVEAACTTSVPNDEPCVALSIPVNSGCIYNGPYTTSCASVTQSANITNPTCGAFTVAGTGATRDVFFSLTVPPSGQLNIDVRSVNIADAAMAVYMPGRIYNTSAAQGGTGVTLNFITTAGIVVGMNVSGIGIPTGATVAAVGPTSITLSAATTSAVPAATPIYFWASPPSCSGTLTQIACDDNSSVNPAMPFLSMTGLLPGATLYIRIWGKNGGSGQFEICATDPCPLGVPANDDPCNAIQMTIGTTYTGYNSCATNTNDPAYPGCWTTGTANTVWYKFTAPSTSVNITTTLGSLTNTQIALYTATFCFSPIPVSGLCNDNYVQCGIATNASQIQATGLTVGGLYYIMLDGFQNLTGTFSITVTDNSATLPAIPQQDCPAATIICSPQTVFGSPGFVGAGNYCDLGPGGSAYGCVPATGARENNSAWFAFNIDTTGVLVFDILPTQSNANYDWVLWNITNQTALGGTPSAAACAAITSNSLAITACNYENNLTSGANTGMGNGGTCLQCGSGQGAYSQDIPVIAGETYLLMINNTSGTAAGFTLDFSNTPVVQYVVSNPLNWSGGTNSTWITSTNWGGCGSPDCAIGANILPGLVQPVITGTVDVGNLIINPGATLTLAAGCTLNVCGNFVNNGTLTANATSTVRFVGTGNQIISGNLTGTSRFGNVVVDKLSGEVVMNTTVEVGRDFTTVNNTSIWNMNNKILRLFRHFTNFNGNTTLKNVGAGAAGSTVEFVGAVQNYTNTGSNLTWNNVTINQPAGFTATVTLANNGTSNLIVGPSGILNFISGRFLTGAANEVIVENTATAGANTGNTNSYVDGALRRYFGTGAPRVYEFAVGNGATGYQRASLDFTTMPSAPYQLSMRFLSWGGSNLPLVAGRSPLECANYDWTARNALNHGYWSTDASTATPTGIYNLTLWNRSFSNFAGGTNLSTSYPISTGQVIPSNVLTLTSTTGLSVGMNVLGPNIPAGATITAVTATTVTMSLPTTAVTTNGDYINFFTSGAAGGIQCVDDHEGYHLSRFRWMEDGSCLSL